MPNVQINIYDDLRPIEIREEGKNGKTVVKYTTPTDLKKALSSVGSIPLIFIHPNLVATDGEKVASFYRPPALTDILLSTFHGIQNIRIPLPALILNLTKGHNSASLAVVALKQNARPASKDTPLYHAPFSNIYSNGGVCMGSAKPVPFSFEPEIAWASFFGSAFNGHNPDKRSNKYPEDVRLLYPELVDMEAYPVDDLVPCNTTLGQWLRIGGGR